MKVDTTVNKKGRIQNSYKAISNYDILLNLIEITLV